MLSQIFGLITYADHTGNWPNSYLTISECLNNTSTNDTCKVLPGTYYGDVEINVKGNFGSVSFYSYNNGYMGGEKKLVYQTNIDRNPDLESNNLYERVGNTRILKFPYYGGDPKNSNYVIGRATTSGYTDNDSGTNLFAYVKSYYKTSEESCFYIRCNGIPNYKPSIFGKEYKSVEFKEEGMSEYRYSITIENSIQEYFSTLGAGIQVT